MKVSILLQIWHQRMTSHAWYNYIVFEHTLLTPFCITVFSWTETNWNASIVWTRKLHNKPSQVRPSAPNWYPLSHWHMYDPGRFKQICWQSCSPVAHSSLSVSDASKTPLKAWQHKQQWPIVCYRLSYAQTHVPTQVTPSEPKVSPSGHRQTAFPDFIVHPWAHFMLSAGPEKADKCILYIVTFHVIKNWAVTY